MSRMPIWFCVICLPVWETAARPPRRYNNVVLRATRIALLVLLALAGFAVGFDLFASIPLGWHPCLTLDRPRQPGGFRL